MNIEYFLVPNGSKMLETVPQNVSIVSHHIPFISFYCKFSITALLAAWNFLSWFHPLFQAH